MWTRHIKFAESSCCRAICIGCACLLSADVLALQSSYTLSADVQHSDNVTRVSTAEPADTKYITRVAAALDDTEGALKYSLQSSLSSTTYGKDTLNGQDYFSLALNSGWELFSRRVILSVRDSFVQRRIDPLGVDVPTNTQDTNIFSLSPAYSARLNKRLSLSLAPEFSRYYYEESNNDNNQHSLSASLRYMMYRQLDVSLQLREREVDYDQPASADNTFRTASVLVSYRGKRSSLNVSVGTTSVKSESQAEVDGATGGLNWRYQPRQDSSINLSYNRQLTDSSNRELVLFIEDDELNFDFVTTTNVYENTVSRIGYQWSRTGDTFSAWASQSEQDYDTSNEDRVSVNYGLRFSHRLGIHTSVSASYIITEVEQESTSRVDESDAIRLSMTHQHSRRLKSRVELKTEQRDSNLDVNDFDEMSLLFGLSYSIRGSQ